MNGVHYLLNITEQCIIDNTSVCGKNSGPLFTMCLCIYHGILISTFCNKNILRDIFLVIDFDYFVGG